MLLILDVLAIKMVAQAKILIELKILISLTVILEGAICNTRAKIMQLKSKILLRFKMKMQAWHSLIWSGNNQLSSTICKAQLCK